MSHDQREKYKAFISACRRAFLRGELPPEFPEDLRGLSCGAQTRAGTPCKRRDLYPNGRCHLHGGPSSGPKSDEGKARSAMNGLLPKRTP